MPQSLHELAKKHGGSVTLADIAARHGGTVSSVEPTAPPGMLADLAAKHGGQTSAAPSPTAGSAWKQDKPTSATSTGSYYLPGVGSISRAGLREFGRTASEMTAEQLKKFGLDKPILGAIDVWDELKSRFTRTPEQKEGLRAVAEERAYREPLRPQWLEPGATPSQTPAIQAIKTLAPLPFEIAGQGIAGGAQALTTSARGTRSLVQPEAPMPTQEEFKRAAGGAAEFANLVGIVGPATAARRKAVAMQRETAVPMVQRNAALGSLARTGVKAKGVVPHKVGSDVRQGARQSQHELGLDPDALPMKNTSDEINEMVIGGTQDDLDRMNGILKAEHDTKIAAGELPPTAEFIPEEATQLAWADRMVEFYHRPIKNAIDRFAQVRRPDIKQRVVDHLLAKAEAEQRINPTLSEAYLNAATEVEAANDTVAGLYALKVKANKMPTRRYSGTPSQQIAADVSVSEAQAEIGDAVRQHLYPAVEQIGKLNGQPMTGKLIEAGRKEHSAIQLRDGVYNEWTKAAFGQASSDLESWWHHTIRGHSESVPILGSPFKHASIANAILRGIQGVDKPMAEFNKLLRTGIGSLKGFVPERAVVSSNLWGAAQPIDVPGGPTPGVRMPGAPPAPGQMGLLERGPSEGGAMAPPSLFGAQTQGPRGTYPTPVDEYQMQLRQRRLWSAGAPQPVPGQMGLFETGPSGGGAMAPPRLFGISQTPHRWSPTMRETSTMSDLQAMEREIDTYLRGPEIPGKARQEFSQDLAAIRHEINRRKEAQRVRPTPPPQ